MTALGGIGVLAFLTLAAAGYLWLSGKRRSMLLLLVAVGGGQLLSTLFKRGFDRPRPDLVPHEALVYTASFPSGHAMMAAVTYLTLARHARARAAEPGAEGLRPGARGDRHRRGRGQPRLPRGALADRRPRRLDRRRRLGAGLLDRRRLAGAARRGRAGGLASTKKGATE